MPTKYPGRQKDVEAIRRLAIRLAPAEYDPHLSCIYHAAATMFYMRRVHGNGNVFLQAGSASWPRLRDDQDDGKPTTPNQFSYVFSLESPGTAIQLAKGFLPEMHAWCYDQTTGCFIDTTVEYQPEACKKMTGMDWPGDPPPPFIWHTVKDMPNRIIYQAHRAAVLIAERGIQQTMNQVEFHKFIQEGKV